MNIYHCYQKVAPKSPVRSQSGDAKNFGTVFDPKVCVAHAVASECLLAPFDFLLSPSVAPVCSSVVPFGCVLCVECARGSD